MFQAKVIGALPGTLEPNTAYFVRVGGGFRVWVTDSNVIPVARPLEINDLVNTAIISKSLQGNVSQVIYEDDFLVIEWDSTNQQPTATTKITTPLGGWSWYDMGVMLMRGNTSSTPNYTADDISATSGVIRYFTTSGVLDNNFNHNNWGSRGFYHVIKEGFATGWPSYSFEIKRGNSGKIDFTLTLTNPSITNYGQYL